MVLQLDDWDQKNANAVFKKLIDKEKEEPFLENRNAARTRHTFLDMCETSRFLKMMRNR